MSLNDLRHPDCRTCEERERLNVGIMAENKFLRQRHAKLLKGGVEALACALWEADAVDEGALRWDDADDAAKAEDRRTAREYIEAALKGAA